GNAVNNMIHSGLQGVDFVVANTDAQALALSAAERRIQMGVEVTQGLGAGSHPEIGRASAEESLDEIKDQLTGAHMVFVTAGMGGGTGTGAAPVVAGLARDQGILTVGVVTKPFQFEGQRRQRIADAGIEEMQKHVDTLIVIPNQNLFRIANEKTTFADAFSMADQVLYSGVACITDLSVKEGLINLDFADVRAVMDEMGKAMMGTGEASGEKRAVEAAEAAISNPLLDDVSMRGARGLLISITGGNDLTLYEVDEAAMRIREEVDSEANIILGATFDDSLEGVMRVSVVATGIDAIANTDPVFAGEAMTNRIKNMPPKIEPRKPVAVEQPAPVAEPVEAEPEPAAPAPVAETSQDGVVIRPMVPEPEVELAEPAETVAAPEPVVQEPAFVPPVAETPASRPAARMPRIDEFPIPAQNELRALQGDDPGHGLIAQQKKTGFFSRLASVGLGRKDHDHEHMTGPEAVVSEPVVDSRRSNEPSAPATVDKHSGIRTEKIAGPDSSHADSDDGHLEIPAFLRRQAN
ncbi:MAG: cell division protein FtsZ, partial [Fimbriimonadaceae bacterium]|nr:cell division protein FtsZ [Alphaproteobacteria bacterium]